MKSIKCTWKNGQIVLDGPAHWPEGCRVSIEPLPESEETFGIREEDWPTTTQGIADWLTWYESLEPLEMTPKEEEDLSSWRQNVKTYSTAKMRQRIEGLFE